MSAIHQTLAIVVHLLFGVLDTLRQFPMLDRIDETIALEFIAEAREYLNEIERLIVVTE